MYKDIKTSEQNLSGRKPPILNPNMPIKHPPPQPPIRSHHTLPYLPTPQFRTTQPDETQHQAYRHQMKPTTNPPTTSSKQSSQRALTNMTPSRAPRRSTSTGAGVTLAIGPRVVRAIRASILSDPTGAAGEGSAERARTPCTTRVGSACVRGFPARACVRAV
jgi:hypothetical protein